MKLYINQICFALLAYIEISFSKSKFWRIRLMNKKLYTNIIQLAMNISNAIFQAIYVVGMLSCTKNALYGNRVIKIPRCKRVNCISIVDCPWETKRYVGQSFNYSYLRVQLWNRDDCVKFLFFQLYTRFTSHTFRLLSILVFTPAFELQTFPIVRSFPSPIL